MKRLCPFLIILIFLTFIMPSASAEFDPSGISTKHVLVMEASTGRVLYEKGGYEMAFPASTTKIMTCILALENGKLNQEITTGEEVRKFGSASSLMGLSRGETLTLEGLLYGLMFHSGNDAAAAIAVGLSGSVEEFSKLMNEKALEIGMADTHFVNPHGRHDENHYSTAYDMALLARYAMQNEQFAKIVGARKFNVPATNKDSDGYQLENANRLIHTKESDTVSYRYQYATGIKTGDTAQAGRCLVAAAKKGDQELIVVLMGDMEGRVSTYYRFENAAKLFDWGFDQCVTVAASTLNLPASLERSVSNPSLNDEKNGILSLEADLTGKTVTLLKAEIEALQADASDIKLEPQAGLSLTAPIKKGDVVGSVSYLYKGATLFTADLIASRDVEALASTSSNLPSDTPLINLPENNTANEGGNSLLFWILLALLIAIVIVVIQILKARRARKHSAKRRRPPVSRRTSYRRY